MKSIKQTVETKDSIDLHVEVSMGGETIIERQADSLVGNFLRQLYGLMIGSKPDNDQKRVLALDESNSDNNATADFTTNATLHQDEYFSNDENLFYLDTSYDAMCGFYYSPASGRDLHLYEVTFDRSTGDVTQGNRVDWSGLDSSQFDGEIYIESLRFMRIQRNDTKMFAYPDVVVGKDLGNTATSVDQQRPANKIGRFNTTGTTKSEPAVQSNSSTITLSRQFTNNKNYDITVGEIGVKALAELYDYQDNDDRQASILIARDSVSDFTVASGNSITIEYKLQLSNSGSGGMMSQFHQLLYRQIQQTKRTVRDINNNDRNNEQAEGQFMVSTLSGDLRQSLDPINTLTSESVGPVVGTGTASVSNTNTSLDNAIPQGTSDGTLYYYGPTVDRMILDEANDEIYFDIVKPCENRGSTTITIEEQALYNSYFSSSCDNYPQYSSMIIRHVFSSSVNVAPGEILKAGYRLKLTV